MASAQVSITVTGTITSAHASHSFTNGDALTFTFAVNDFAPASVNGSFTTGSESIWNEETVSHPILFSDLTGTGLAGTWVRPMADTISPASLLRVFDGSGIGLDMGADSGAATGLTHNGLEFNLVTVSAILSNFNAVTGGSLLYPKDYLETILGAYTATAGTGQFAAGGFTSNFAVTGVNITTSAVPEPSSYAAMLGGLALVGVMLRRRRVPAL